MQVAPKPWFTVLVTLVKREYQEQRLLFVLLPLGFVVLLQVFMTAKLIDLGLREIEMVTLPMGGQFMANVSGLEQILVNAEGLATLPREVIADGLGALLEPPLVLLGATYWTMLLCYFLMTLYQQRQNRSILFWSSMPVSNTQTLLSKLLGAYVVAGGTYMLTGLLMLVQILVSISVFGLFKGMDVWTLYITNAHIFARFSEFFLTGLMGILWCLPVHGTVLLASSWAKRAPFAWVAAGPILLIGFELIISSGRDRDGNPGSMMLELITTHAFPRWAFQPADFDLAGKYAMFWSWELVFSVLLGSALIALAIHFNRVDE